MGLGLPLGALLGLGVLLVVLAHALRKGRAEPLVFPAARLIDERAASAKERHRIEDRWLLLLRSLMVLALALLAASPFVQCSRLRLARENGASVSGVLVIDDSASMQATVQGQSRLSRAIESSRELLSDTQVGDAFSVVLAGAPARVLMPSTTDIESVKEALAGIEPSDRGTDLSSALSLARSLQSHAAQANQPIIVLSDLSISERQELDLDGVSIPQAGLTQTLSNCAIISAAVTEQSVICEVTCTDDRAISDRKLQLLDKQGKVWGPLVVAHDGAVNIPFAKNADSSAGKNIDRVRLTASKVDQIKSDDESLVLKTTSKLSIAVRADIAKAGVKTGLDTVLQSGIEALERGVRVEPLSLLPDDETELAGYAGLLIDDPSGFSPETRKAIEGWVRRGGVAAVFLGPGIDRTPLSSNFLPFLQTAPIWTKKVTSGTNPQRPGALGPLTTTWNDLNAKGRALFSLEQDDHALASWTDTIPLIAEQSLGQGLLITSSLPSSVDLSDFALRPAYLELLDHIVVQATVRLGSFATPVGQKWRVARGTTVVDQDGRRLPVLAGATDPNRQQSATSSENWVVAPDRAGIYQLTTEGVTATRHAVRLAEEHIGQPRLNLAASSTSAQKSGRSKVGISREVALVVLLLSVIELLIRLFFRENSGFARPNLHQRKTSTKVAVS